MTTRSDRSRREYQAALGLAWISESGCHSILKLLAREGVEAVWTASRRRLLDWGISLKAAIRFEEQRDRFTSHRAETIMQRGAIRFLPFGSSLYPRELAHLALPPAGLFVRGAEEALRRLVSGPRITIVGTRKATGYGLRAAEVFASAFSVEEIAVVSGMALGIDALAHEATLRSGGLTVAVLGCGVDVVYPRRHASLYEKIVQSGVVMSELPPGTTPSRWTFPHRNRLLAALGDAVMVVEASCASGALQTADWALELGRLVLSVPGPILVEGHEGCNRLLCEGAHPALDPRGAVEDFFWATRMQTSEHRSSSHDLSAGRGWVAQHGSPSVSDGRKRSILDCLTSGPCSVDDLVERTGLSARELTAALAELELARETVRAGPGLYIRAP